MALNGSSKPANSAGESAVVALQVVLPGAVAPDGLQLRRSPLAAPGAGQVLVTVEATGMSFAEQAMRRGKYYGQPAFPFVPGYDLVGTVAALGPAVDPGLLGQRVAALTKTGGWATDVLLPADDLIAVPAGLDPAEVEALIVNGITAWQMLHRTAQVRPGQTILVHGANGGVGTTLVQLARHHGVRVIGTASPRHHQALRTLGVIPLDYRDADLSARVIQIAPDGVDAVFDHLGGESIPRSYRLLSAAGHPRQLRHRRQAERRRHRLAAAPVPLLAWPGWSGGTTFPTDAPRRSTTSGPDIACARAPSATASARISPRC